MSFVAGYMDAYTAKPGLYKEAGIDFDDPRVSKAIKKFAPDKYKFMGDPLDTSKRTWGDRASMFAYNNLGERFRDNQRQRVRDAIAANPSGEFARHMYTTNPEARAGMQKQIIPRVKQYAGQQLKKWGPAVAAGAALVGVPLLASKLMSRQRDPRSKQLVQQMMQQQRLRRQGGAAMQAYRMGSTR